jgi:hypothetical protein
LDQETLGEISREAARNRAETYEKVRAGRPGTSLGFAVFDVEARETVRVFDDEGPRSSTLGACSASEATGPSASSRS